MLKLTKQQSDIVRVIAGSQEFMVSALAGTGKTETMCQGLHRDKLAPFKKKTRAMAVFGAANARDMKTRVPSNVKAGTIHSLMFGQLLQQLEFPSDPNNRVNPDRAWNNLNEILDEEGRKLPRGGRPSIRRLVSLAKNTGITSAELTTPTGFLEDLIARHSLGGSLPVHQLIDYSTRVLQMSADTSRIKREGIDFDDQIWLSYFLQLRPHRLLDLLILDECQDTNVVQQWDARSLTKVLGAVGDVNQAVYAFRGADAAAVASLAAVMPGHVVLPLTICWRCCKSVIRLAQGIVPAIEWAPQAEEGSVEEVAPSDVIELAQPGDMIVCRTNAPLIPVVFSLWGIGKRAYIQGRRFGEDLLAIVKDEERYNMSLPDLVASLHDRQQREEAVLMKLPEYEAQLAFLRDKYDCLYSLAQRSSSALNGVQELKQRLDFIFSDVDDRSKIRLSSIHRAKGLEADTVIILEPHLLPHPMATQDWEQQQERNLAYVAATRARKRLLFAGSIPAIYSQTVVRRDPYLTDTLPAGTVLEHLPLPPIKKRGKITPAKPLKSKAATKAKAATKTKRSR